MQAHHHKCQLRPSLQFAGPENSCAGEGVIATELQPSHKLFIAVQTEDISRQELLDLCSNKSALRSFWQLAKSFLEREP